MSIYDETHCDDGDHSSTAGACDTCGWRPVVDPEMVEWLCGVMGYPYDFSVEPPVPAAWRSAIEQFWFDDDGDTRYEASIKRTVAEEGRWSEADV